MISPHFDLTSFDDSGNFSGSNLSSESFLSISEFSYNKNKTTAVVGQSTSTPKQVSLIDSSNVLKTVQISERRAGLDSPKSDTSRLINNSKFTQIFKISSTNLTHIIKIDSM